MNVLQRTLQRALGLEVKKVGDVVPGADAIVPRSAQGQSPQRSWTQDRILAVAANSCEVAANCMVFRADGVAKAPFGAVIDGEYQPDHPLSQLYHHPNDFYSQSDFWHQVLYTLQASAGGAYIVAPLNNVGQPLALWVRSDKFVKPVADVNSFISGYMMRTADGQWRTVDPNQYLIWQHRFVPMDCDDLYGSWPPLLRAARAVRSFSHLGAYVENILQNKAMLDGFITFKNQEEVDPDIVPIIDERLGARLNGPTQAGGLRFLPGNFDFIQMSQSLADVNPGEIQDRLETAICGSFQLNPVSVRTHAGMGVTSGLGGDKISALIAQDYQGTVASDWNLLRGDDAIVLAERFGLSPDEVGFDTSNVAELKESEDARYERVKGALFLSPNQALVQVGEDPSDNPLADLPLAVLNALATAHDLPGETPLPVPGGKSVVRPFRVAK